MLFIVKTCVRHILVILSLLVSTNLFTKIKEHILLYYCKNITCSYVHSLVLALILELDILPLARAFCYLNSVTEAKEEKLL